jgi:hypothetical protein
MDVPDLMRQCNAKAPPSKAMVGGCAGVSYVPRAKNRGEQRSGQFAFTGPAAAVIGSDRRFTSALTAAARHDVGQVFQVITSVERMHRRTARPGNSMLGDGVLVDPPWPPGNSGRQARAG